MAFISSLSEYHIGQAALLPQPPDVNLVHPVICRQHDISLAYPEEKGYA
jgi:hypothetical protein